MEVREGVKAGETLVVRGAEALKDGSGVRIVEEKKPVVTGEPGTGGAAKTGGATP